jgi:hypothetical protein
MKKNIKGILIGALTVPVLALTGGLAYASTTTGGHPTQARPAATATIQNHAQYPASQTRHDWCDWRYSGYWCDWHGHGYTLPAQATHQRHHRYQHAAYRHHSYRHNHGYRGYGSWGHQGGQGYGYQGNGYQGGWGNGGSGNYGGWGHGSGSYGGNRGCCGGHGW